MLLPWAKGVKEDDSTRSVDFESLLDGLEDILSGRVPGEDDVLKTLEELLGSNREGMGEALVDDVSVVEALSLEVVLLLPGEIKCTKTVREVRRNVVVELDLLGTIVVDEGDTVVNTIDMLDEVLVELLVADVDERGIGLITGHLLDAVGDDLLAIVEVDKTSGRELSLELWEELKETTLVMVITAGGVIIDGTNVDDSVAFLRERH